MKYKIVSGGLFGMNYMVKSIIKEDTPQQIFKKHPDKNTNFGNTRKKHQQTKHQFLKKAKKTTKRNTPKKYLPDYHWLSGG